MEQLAMTRAEQVSAGNKKGRGASCSTSSHHSQGFAYPKRQPSASTHSRATALSEDGPKPKAKIGELGSENGVGFLLTVHHLRLSIQ
jgi:hypothetical protein